SAIVSRIPFLPARMAENLDVYQTGVRSNIFDRDGRLPTIVASQTSAAYWLEPLPDRAGADSLVTRLNSGQRINIADYDMRQHLSYTNDPTNQQPRTPGAPVISGPPGPPNNPEPTPTTSPEKPYQITGVSTITQDTSSTASPH